MVLVIANESLEQQGHLKIGISQQRRPIINYLQSTWGFEASSSKSCLLASSCRPSRLKLRYGGLSYRRPSRLKQRFRGVVGLLLKLYVARTRRLRFINYGGGVSVHDTIIEVFHAIDLKLKTSRCSRLMWQPFMAFGLFRPDTSARRAHYGYRQTPYPTRYLLAIAELTVHNLSSRGLCDLRNIISSYLFTKRTPKLIHGMATCSPVWHCIAKRLAIQYHAV